MPVLYQTQLLLKYIYKWTSIVFGWNSWLRLTPKKDLVPDISCKKPQICTMNANIHICFTSQYRCRNLLVRPKVIYIWCSNQFSRLWFTIKKARNTSNGPLTRSNRRRPIWFRKAHFIYSWVTSDNWGYDFDSFEQKMHLSGEGSRY